MSSPNHSSRRLPHSIKNLQHTEAYDMSIPTVRRSIYFYYLDNTLLIVIYSAVIIYERNEYLSARLALIFVVLNYLPRVYPNDDVLVKLILRIKRLRRLLRCLLRRLLR